MSLSLPVYITNIFKNNKKSLHTGFYTGMAIIAAATFGLFTFVNQSAQVSANESKAPTARALPVSVVKVTMSDSYQARRSFTGRALARQISQLAFEQNGKIDTISVDIGATVSKGDSLAKLNIDRLAARLNELEAQARSAKADYKLAKQTLTRTQKTFDQGHVSAQRRDEAEANYNTSKGRHDNLLAAIETLKIDIEKANLRAPYNGTITQRLQDEGSVIAAGRPVLEITEDSHMEAHIGMSPDFARQLTQGGTYSLYDNRRKKIEGATIKSYVPVISGETRSMMVRFALPKDRITRGELITAIVYDTYEASGSWIPLRALSADVRGLWRVYKITNDPQGPTVHYETVQILYTDKDRAYVTGTLQEGDLIIKDGIDRLAAGQLVKILPMDSLASKGINSNAHMIQN